MERNDLKVQCHENFVLTETVGDSEMFNIHMAWQFVKGYLILCRNSA